MVHVKVRSLAEQDLMSKHATPDEMEDYSQAKMISTILPTAERETSRSADGKEEKIAKLTEQRKIFQTVF